MAHIRGATLKRPESILIFTEFMCRAEGKLKLKEGKWEVVASRWLMMI